MTAYPMLVKGFGSGLRPIAATLITLVGIGAIAEPASEKQLPYLDKQGSQEYWADFKQDTKQTWKDSKAAFKDGWIEGKLETALMLNEHLDTFKIGIEVNETVATLTGRVSSDIEKELAENIALGIAGIDSVKNDLKIDSTVKTTDEAKPLKRNFSQYFSDVSVTAAIKTELLASGNIKGLNIKVDTHNGLVTLSGSVGSGVEKTLAEAIAMKYSHSQQVKNELIIAPQ